jgi:hypothetical protein
MDVLLIPGDSCWYRRMSWQRVCGESSWSDLLFLFLDSAVGCVDERSYSTKEMIGEWTRSARETGLGFVAKSGPLTCLCALTLPSITLKTNWIIFCLLVWNQLIPLLSTSTMKTEAICSSDTLVTIYMAPVPRRPQSIIINIMIISLPCVRPTGLLRSHARVCRVSCQSL